MNKYVKSKSLDTLSSIRQTKDLTRLRNIVEKYVQYLIENKIISTDVLSNQAMKFKLISMLMDNEKLSYIEYGKWIYSMFMNVIQSRIIDIPIHSQINLDEYFTNNIIMKLDDDEYLSQNLTLVNEF